MDLHVTFENLFTYGPTQYQTVLHVLTLGYAAMFGGGVYFLATAKSISPRYRLSSYLSAVVMASALLELYAQANVWSTAFVLDPATELEREGRERYRAFLDTLVRAVRTTVSGR